MAGERHPFGGSIADWVFDRNDANIPVLTGGVTIQAWSAPDGGTQYTNLTQDLAGTVPITTLVSSDGTGGLELGTIPRFYGPPDVTRMWLSADGGPRLAVVATDIGEKILATEVALVSHDGQRNAHDTRVFDLTDVLGLTAEQIDDIPDGWVLAWDATLKKFKARPTPIWVVNADPDNPIDSDFWYNKTDRQLRIRRGDTTESISTDGTDDGDGDGGGPTKPGEMLTLSKWELTLPIGGDGGDPDNPLDIYAPALNTYSSEYFKIVTDGNGVKCVEFVAPVKGVTTSSSSGATRSELREMGSVNGGSSGPKAAWSFNDNIEHDLIVTMTADPTGIVNGRKEIIIGQIHGAKSTPIPIILAADFNSLPGRVTFFKNGSSSGGALNFLTGLTATTRFTYRIRKTAGGSSSRLQVSIALGNKADLPATPQFDFPISDFSDTALYYKCGAYNKTEIDDSDATGSGKTRIYAMSLDGVGYIVPTA